MGKNKIHKTARTAVSQRLRTFSAMLTNTSGSRKETAMLATLNLVNECYARGIKFLPVNFFKSKAFAYVPEDGRIRLPFNSLAGVGENAALAIETARDGGEILSVEDLRLKAKLTKAVVEVLKENGALEGLSDTNQITFF